ncbi:LON peptidase substrate-binding domain-containing protein [Saccharomonospora glauca]|uniref:Peptidase S16, lon domain protein n=1 Tax=Saccharomonospora glauca K62 TaxID=928724 RepID=I1CZJ9_9PSEU|nr:LON peptidase substrate-binding domain-containing protein [Saccharomonospora glauca]EIE98123.1 peptidase S16, lon domain protein [Saccharomonospora glauca K62]
MTHSEGHDSQPTARTTLPLFPLHTVALPGVHLPLHIFEPRYRQLTIDLVTEVVPERLFGVAAIRNPTIDEVDELAHVHAVGCAVRLREARRLPDGRFDIVTTGHRRFRLLELDTESAPYLRATVTWLDDEPLPVGSEETVARLADVGRAAHRRYCSVAWQSGGWQSPPQDTEPALLAYLLASDCLLPLADRQELLEERNPLRRLRLAHRLLTREATFVSELRAVPPPQHEIPETLLRPNLN